VLSPDAASGESLTAASFSSLTPDIYGSNAAPAPAALISRPPSPPFILADAAKLGIPVFKQPIAPPKFNLTLFPKVSPWFAPLNGGDVGTFPRKEHVRKWGQNQKTFVGIGVSNRVTLSRGTTNKDKANKDTTTCLRHGKLSVGSASRQARCLTAGFGSMTTTTRRSSTSTHRPTRRRGPDRECNRVRCIPNNPTRGRSPTSLRGPVATLRIS